MLEDPNLRPNVGILLINDDQQILAGEALHYSGEWMMPQGGINPDETPCDAMQRELLEETGIAFKEVELLHESENWLSYCFRKPLVKEGKRYTGQRQKWFHLSYNGPLPDANNTIEREFREFQWVDAQWLLQHTTPFKVQVYQSIFSEFDIDIAQLEVS